MSKHHAPPRLNVLHIASEVAPYSKTGGLGDVASALPVELQRLGVHTSVVTPRYRSVDPTKHGLAKRITPLSVPIGDGREPVTLYEGTLPGGVVRVTFVDHPVFDRPGLYGDAGGDYPDNAWRFALLCRAALEHAAQRDVWPDIIHAHDWQAALALLYARRGFHAGRPIPRTVLTIHNLAFQGLAPKAVVEELGLGWDLFHAEGVEFYDQVSLLKAGVVFADRVTTVSPRYAREIQLPHHGAGLDGFLRARAGKVVGILNGIDTLAWNPATDGAINAHYDAIDRTGKARCKIALQRELGLAVKAQVPVIGWISRLTEQKGIELVVKAQEELSRLDAQIVFLGQGEPRYQAAIEQLARRFPGKIAARAGYDEGLAHRIQAGSDLFLVPSQFEPCGLNQLYAFRYGTIPVVHSTGGLDDTVVDYDEKTRTGTGFKFPEFTPGAMISCLRRAIATYRRSTEWQTLVGHAMGLDFGWAASAARYVELYEELVPPPEAAAARPSAFRLRGSAAAASGRSSSDVP